MNRKTYQEILEKLQKYIEQKNNAKIIPLLEGLHAADIAEILDKVSFEQALYIIRLLDSDITSDILAELDDNLKQKILDELTPKEIAEEVEELETDDAADIIAELPENKKEEVISHIDDKEHAKDILELLRYDEDTAGGLMGKEFIQVNENWNVLRSVIEMRKQAEEIEKVHTIYVVDDKNKLKGRLSLKSLLTTSTKTPIKEVYNDNIHFVKVNTPADEVAQTMQKYDLFVIPVVDELGTLVGQITLDDIVDYIKEEAERDYQLAAGISDDVEADDNIFHLIKARLPWLIVALFGGVISVTVLNSFGDAMTKYGTLFFFTPLIAATAGNVGVQSSAIIVQSLANGTIDGSILKRLLKEVTLSLINGIILAIILMLIGEFLLSDLVTGFNMKIAITIAISLVSVIITASLIGTFTPLFLHKKGIDPAVATGPFITTSNDIFGIYIFFSIAKLILGF